MELTEILNAIDSLGTLGLLIVVLYAFWSGNLLSKKVYDKLVEGRDRGLICRIEELLDEKL